MENYRLVLRSKRLMCSSGKGLPLRTWGWCLLIQCWIAAPGVLGTSRDAALYPEGNIFVRYGDPLEIYCTTENYSSDEIEFRFKGDRLESERVNETTRRLYIKNPEKQRNEYYCQNKITGRTSMSLIHVDFPPADVTDFRCISRNLEVLNCSWTNPHPHTFKIYTVTFTIPHMAVNPSFDVQTTNLDIFYFVWNADSLPRYRISDETLYFHMLICNAFGCIEQNFTVDHYSIVKPSPPTNLTVSRIEPHSVILKWRLPNNIFDFISEVEHIIEYQMAIIDNATSFHRVNSSALPPRNSTYEFQLSLPYANQQYEVRIYIKTKKAVKREFWSDFSHIVVYTLGERPDRPPEMVTGAYEENIWEGKRIIYVYWKQLEEYKSGNNLTYKVLYTQRNKTFPIVFPDKNKSLSYVVITDVSWEELNVYVWSSNKNGTSLTSSHMYIPQMQEKDDLIVTSFSKLSHENGTYQLFWEGIENIDNYTLIWCHHDISRICSGRIDFVVINGKKNNHIIDLPQEYRYQFAISANNGTRTSSMVWAKCDISIDGFAMYKIPARLHYDALGPSSVRLSWWLDCALQHGIITGYNITYIGLVNWLVDNKHIYIPEPKQMDVVIEDLYPSTIYSFGLSIKTIYGQKYIEDATAVFATTTNKK